MNKFKKALHFIVNSIDETSEFYEKIYLVGGCVRDEMLGARFTDLDLLIDMPDGQKKFVEYMCATYPNICKGPFYYKRYGTTAMDLIIDHTFTLVECVEPHVEVYNEDGTELIDTYFCTLEEDARRRDYTCNALYKNIHTGKIYDPSGMAIDDINAKYLRTPGDPIEIYKQDPVRMLRGIRFKHQKDFKLDPKAWDAICELHALIETSAQNRVQEEVHKILKCKRMPTAIADLQKCGLLKHLIPSIEQYMDKDLHPHHVTEELSLWEHTMMALDILHKEHPQGESTPKLVVLLADIAMFEGIEAAQHILKNSLLGKEKTQLVLQQLSCYLRFHKLFHNGVYTERRPSVLPRFINSVATHRTNFRRLVRALNNGLKKEYLLPFQIFYDNPVLPRYNQPAPIRVFSEEETDAYRRHKQEARRRAINRRKHQKPGEKERQRLKRKKRNERRKREKEQL